MILFKIIMLQMIPAPASPHEDQYQQAGDAACQI